MQDHRQKTMQIQQQLDRIGTDLTASITNLTLNTSTAQIRETIRLLREEETAARPSPNGFANSEAEKIISALIDQLGAVEERKVYVVTTACSVLRLK